MALCQKFGRLLIGADARFFALTDITNFSTSLDQSHAPKQIHTRLPPGYKAPNAFALYVKDQMMGKSGGGVSVMVKIISTNWKSLGENEKQNYSERAKKIGDELRDNFEKLTDGQKKDLWDKHVEKMNKRRRLQMKRKLNKFHAETNRPKQPLSSYMLFMKERFVKHIEPFKTRDERLKFVIETGQQWRQMTEAEKKPYVDQAQGDRAEYRLELAEWKKNHADEIKAWKKANKPKAKAALKEKRQKKVLKPKKTKAAKALKRGSKQKKTKEVKAKPEGSVEKEEWSNDDEEEEAIQQEKRQKKVQKRGKKPKKTEEEPAAESYVENAAPKMTET